MRSTNLFYRETVKILLEIRPSDPALGRPRKDEQSDKKQNYADECERIEVERRFSLAKRKCNLGLVSAKLKDTAFHCIAMSIVVLNLRKLSLSFDALIKIFFEWFHFEKFAVIQ